MNNQEVLDSIIKSYLYHIHEGNIATAAAIRKELEVWGYDYGKDEKVDIKEEPLAPDPDSYYPPSNFQGANLNNVSDLDDTDPEIVARPNVSEILHGKKSHPLKLKPGQWTRKHKSCIVCHETKRAHIGKGLCSRCYPLHRKEVVQAWHDIPAEIPLPENQPVSEENSEKLCLYVQMVRADITNEVFRYIT